MVHCTPHLTLHRTDTSLTPTIWALLPAGTIFMMRMGDGRITISVCMSRSLRRSLRRMTCRCSCRSWCRTSCPKCFWCLLLRTCLDNRSGECLFLFLHYLSFDDGAGADDIRRRQRSSLLLLLVHQEDERRGRENHKCHQKSYHSKATRRSTDRRRSTGWSAAAAATAATEKGDSFIRGSVRDVMLMMMISIDRIVAGNHDEWWLMAGCGITLLMRYLLYGNSDCYE